MEPEAFGYCWHRNNGEFYYGIHRGSIDDGYTGSGVKFMRKFNGSCRSEWRRTIEFRGSWEECNEWESDIVTVDMIEQPDCLNLRTGGNQGTCSEETKALRSQQTVELWQNEEYRAKHADNKRNTGNQHSEETRAKISESNKGKKLSDDTKEKLRQANLGKKNPPASLERIPNCLLYTSPSPRDS